MKGQIKKISQATLVALLICWAVSVSADNAYNFDQHVVYYNAFTADNLPAEMASRYGITRSKSRGVLNISVQKKGQPGKMSVPVEADVKARVRNLVGQEKSLNFKRIAEGDSIYYISQFRVSHRELNTFYIEVTPDGSTKAQTFSFKQQFYTN